MLGYSGLSSRSSIQRKSGTSDNSTQTGLPKGARHMCHRGVGGNDQIHLQHQGRGIGEIGDARCQVDQAHAGRRMGRLHGNRPELKAIKDRIRSR